METVELRSSGEVGTVCLRFPEDVDVHVSVDATLSRSAVLKDVLLLVDDKGDELACLGAIHAPAGLLRNWLNFVTQQSNEEQKAVQSQNLVLALKVCYDALCLCNNRR